VQYGVTARGQVTEGRTIGEIAGYAAAVGAGLAMAGNADASIIYSGVRNISVSIDPAAQATNNQFSHYASGAIDVDGGGTDVRLGAAFGAQVYATRSAKYIGVGVLSAAAGAAFMGTGNFLGASRLAAGDTVSAGQNFGATLAGRARYQSVTTDGGGSIQSAGNFAPGETGFVGIRLGGGNFGWIRLRVDDLGLNQPFKDLLAGYGDGYPPIGDGQGYPDKVTVIDWAYEDSFAGELGNPIHAGDTGPTSVPEPSSLALLAAGAAGIAAFRRRRAAQAR
jgi:hypothetical protein